MKVHEYFASYDSIESLTKKILNSGFTKFSGWPDSYSVNGNQYAFITMHQVENKGFVTSKGGPKNVFYLELSKEPSKYPKNHPVSKLFQSLDNPTTLGNIGCEPKYSIDTYTK